VLVQQAPKREQLEQLKKEEHKMDYSGVDIIVVLDANGNVDAVYTASGRERVAVLDWHWDDQDKITEATLAVGMPRDAREKFQALIKTERRHYHVGNMDKQDFRLYKEIEDAMNDLQECLEETQDYKSNWAMFACADQCEGIR